MWGNRRQLEIGSHWPWSEIEAVSAVPHDRAVALAACHQPGGCRRIPYIWSERKNSVRKTGERWGPWKFRPSTAYGALQPHTRVQTWVPGQWVGYSCAVPGCHNSVGQMSPGRTLLLLLLLCIYAVQLYAPTKKWAPTVCTPTIISTIGKKVLHLFGRLSPSVNCPFIILV